MELAGAPLVISGLTKRFPGGLIALGGHRPTGGRRAHALGELRAALPTHYAYAWADLLAADVDPAEMAAGVFSGLADATVFGLLAARRFATKDISS